MNMSGFYASILLTLFFIFSFSAASISPSVFNESVSTLAPYILILSESIGVLATSMVAFFNFFGHPTDIVFSRMNPSDINESFRELPCFFIILICVKSFLPFNLKIASTPIFANRSFCWVNNLLLKVVFAKFKSYFLNFSSLSTSKLMSLRVFRHSFLAILKPSMINWGWILMFTKLSACFKSSDANTATVVVPSPTWSSCDLEISIIILAAALSMNVLFRMVAPSFVTCTSPPGPP